MNILNNIEEAIMQSEFFNAAEIDHRYIVLCSQELYDKFSQELIENLGTPILIGDIDEDKYRFAKIKKPFGRGILKLTFEIKGVNGMDFKIEPQ